MFWHADKHSIKIRSSMRVLWKLSGELATTFDPAELEAQEAKVLRHAVD
jgi:hypothetical protein